MHRRSRKTLASLTAAGALTLGLGTVGASALPTATPSVGFTVPTVVDQYRPGYEPDNVTVPEISGDSYSGSTFVSMPNGFSTTQSYIWRSDDDRQSFHQVEGNFAGKTTTCVGGGDSEMQVDPINGHFFFADLQGLTNFSNSESSDGGHTFDTSCNSVPGTGVDRQWEAIDDNGGTSAVGPGATGGVIYFDYDNVDQASGPSNQLVMNESLDGVNFGAGCVGANVSGTTVSGCPAPPAQISNNETIPGNVEVDDVPGSAYLHRVYAIHTGDSGSSVVMSYCSGAPGDATASTVAADCTNPLDFTPSTTDPQNRTNEYWRDTYVQVPGAYETGQLFPSLAEDTAGNLYAAWSQYPKSSAGAVDGPGQIMMSTSTDGAQHWSTPVAISQAGVNEAVMPWITAGDPGRVGISYYSADDTVDGDVGPDGSVTASWNLDYAFSEDALAAGPAFSVNQVNEAGHPVKFGDISTGGLGGAEDRSLGDFFQVHAGPQGQAIISYVDDTSADRSVDTTMGSGETPPEAAGPVMAATQNSGPGLFAADTVPALPTNDAGTVSVDPTLAAKDSFLSEGGQDVAGAANQQLLGSTVTEHGTNLVVTLRTADPNLASDLSTGATLSALGGPVADWLVRWAAPAYAAQSSGYANCPAAGNTCDGNIFYVGMESDAGGAPSFYTGTTQGLTTTHTKYLEYPQEDTTDVVGTISGDTITWTVPLSDVGSPAAGQGIYSVTGFTSTQATPSPTTTVPVSGTGGEVGAAEIPNVIDSTPAYDYTLPALAGPGGALPEVPYLPLLLAPVAGLVWLGVRRRRQPSGASA